MITIIAGSRDITSPKFLDLAIQECGWKPSLVISGGSRGVDRMGEVWAKRNRVDVKIFQADWKTYGKSAGYRRNLEMANYAEALIAIWDGASPGTQHMINIAQQKKLKVFVKLKKPISLVINKKDDPPINEGIVSEPLLFKTVDGKWRRGYFHSNGFFYSSDKDTGKDEYIFAWRIPYTTNTTQLLQVEGWIEWDNLSLFLEMRDGIFHSIE